MIPEARPAFRLVLALAFLSAGAILARGQDRSAPGLPPGRLAEALAESGAAPLLSLTGKVLSEAGAFGPDAYYYLARRLDAPPSENQPRIAKTGKGTAAAPEVSAAARRLYRRAFDDCSGLLRREAGIALLKNLDAAGLWNELLAFSCEYEREVGPDWDLDRLRLGAADALGMYADTASLAAYLSEAYPEEAAEDSDALAYYSALAALRGYPTGSPDDWKPSFRRLVLVLPFSDWSARTFDLLRFEPRLAASFSAEELHAVAMREAVRRRDYAEAYREARLAPTAALSLAASKAMVADAGKAFLYSGRSKEGEELFGSLEAAAAKGPEALNGLGGIAWTALFYRARFARALERWATASTLFKQAAAWASERADADSCLWYAVDCSYRGALASAALAKRAGAKAAAGPTALASLLEALSSASASWNDAERFSDLVDGLLGDALRAREFGLVESMAERLGGKLGPESEARVAYAAARILELRLGVTSSADRGSASASAAVRFSAIAGRDSTPLYYRALASWRAGIEPVLVPKDARAARRAANPPTGELEAFLGGMAGFGLVDLAFTEIRAREEELDDEALRRLALRFSSSGRPDYALRLAFDLSSREEYRPVRADYELLYPRPYLDLIGARSPDAPMTEALAFGLVRSESVFNPSAASRAGAVGLTQLMPATAAAQAKALGLKSYDLKLPKDNLDIGLAHFASLIRRTESRPLRAMMAYNAGWGRYRSGTAGIEGLPDDLVVEAFGIEETREYCRKILQATVMYDALYYGKGLGATVGGLVRGD